MSISQIKTGLRFFSLGNLYYELMIVLLVEDEDKEREKQTQEMSRSTHLKTQSSFFSPPPLHGNQSTKNQKQKTYNSGDSLVVTHPTTNPPI
jgi:hypothetical protein